MKLGFKIVYAALGLATVAAFVPSIVWAASESVNVDETIVEKAELSLSGDVQKDYIEGEPFNPEGVSIVCDGETFPASELEEVVYDFGMSGTRVVELFHNAGQKKYRALLPVTVHHVRHIDVRDKTITLKEDGTFDTSKMVIWADLAEPTKAFPKPDEFSGEDQSVIILNSRQFKVEMKESSEGSGSYNGTLTVGKIVQPMSYYDSSVYNPARELPMINASGTSDRLTLYVETNSNNFAWPDGTFNVECTGTYTLKKASDGSETKYKFSYVLQGWTSVFRSNSVDSRVNDSYGAESDPEGFTCVVEGLTFYALRDAWHVAVLGAVG